MPDPLPNDNSLVSPSDEEVIKLTYRRPDPLPYDNPLITRYASRPMVELWGPQRKHSTWRRLWLTLAEAEYELGLTADDGHTPRITPAQLAELQAHLDDIDFAAPPNTNVGCGMMSWPTFTRSAKWPRAAATSFTWAQRVATSPTMPT